MADLTQLPNIGKTLAAELENIGVTTREELTEIGSVETARRVAKNRSGACYNLLFALEGAIRGVRWHSLPKPDRETLKRCLDEARARIDHDP